ncbi:hypothetical protein Cs7R123_55500 [Catellatospora sp. TT07R-123]|uniref:hypothetical protein n=1 Tax=Catellatospora sp. TT07R-123 TaxID=2733863 RepID=UPI001B20A5AF|nr:hypothetical protein [Catellatospora sp. TT07R-123]GHJ48208.1 hypothetical protein Cs7R123_55500 [Catellatospora sp. TT07R-123]
MSMHDIEDLVFESVLLLDARHPGEDDRLRDWVTALYAFQDRFDCSHTKGRVLDILLRRRHTYRFALQDHPDYAERREFLDGLADFEALREVDEDSDDFEGFGGWLEDGYVDPPWLYCEAGTDLWQRMVDAGRLTGADAVAPGRTALIELVAEIAAAAEQAGDVDLVAQWWALGPGTLVDGTPLWADDLAAIPAVVRLREIVRRTGAWSVSLPDGYRPDDDELELLDDERETWWFRVAD